MGISNYGVSSNSDNQQYLFGRSYKIAIGAPGQQAAVQFSNEPVLINGILTVPSSIRVKFDVHKNPLGTPNNCKFELFNLAQETRQAIKKGFILQMQAGYNGLMDTIFIGNVRPDGIKNKRQGADIETHIECGDGEAAIVLSSLDKSYPPGTNLVTILQDVAATLSVTSDLQPGTVTAGTVVGIPPVTYGRGISIHGPCNATLDKLLKPQGLRWSVQNGKLDIIPVTANNGAEAIVVSVETGMIGVPSFNGQYMEFQSLLNPKLAPNALVKVISENDDPQINGFFVIKTAHYEGDTHSNSWHVSCQCTPQPNVVQALSVRLVM